MYTRLKRAGRIVMAILVLLFIAVLIFVRTNGAILLRTYTPFYDGCTRGVLVNLSRYAIDTRFREPLIYELSDFGWLPPFFFFTMVYYPPAYEYGQGLIQPGSIRRVDMSFLETKAMEQVWILLEQKYFYNGNEYVVYSNKLILDKPGQPQLSRPPPVARVEAPSIYAEVIEPYVVSLSNNATEAVWFNSICSGIEVSDRPSGHYPHTTLQRQTGEGTWQVFRPDKSQCTTISKPIRIEPGETIHLFLGDGYSPLDALEPGVYRWHLVYYVEPTFPQECDYFPCILAGAHLFTETFEQ